jgi:hypothetical protein
MNDTNHNVPRSYDWRFPVSIGLAIGLGVPLSQRAEKALQPLVGSFGAFSLGLLIAGAVGGIVGLTVCLFFRRRKGTV